MIVAMLDRDRRQPFGERPVEVLEFAAAAGAGTPAGQEPRAGVVRFRRDWRQRLDLDPAQCAALRVRGESMRPTPPAGSAILIDRSRTWRRDGEIFALQTAAGMVVKRAVKGADGVILGQVVWTARALV